MREPVWLDIFRDIRDTYNQWMGKLRAVLRPINPRKATDEESRTICEATRMVMNSVLLASLTFPGKHVEQWGSEALTEFETAHDVTSGQTPYSENIGLRRDELQKFLADWLPNNREGLRRWIEEAAPGNLDLADEPPPE